MERELALAEHPHSQRPWILWTPSLSFTELIRLGPLNFKGLVSEDDVEDTELLELLTALSIPLVDQARLSSGARLGSAGVELRALGGSGTLHPAPQEPLSARICVGPE